MRLSRTCAAVGVVACLGQVTTGPAAADDMVLHDVTYTVYTEQPFFADIYYRDSEPENFADYSHDPYMFSPKVEADLGPDKPWVLNAKLANPRHWAMVMGTSGQSPNPPTFHCTLAVDGVVQVTDSGPKGALCSLRLW